MRSLDSSQQAEPQQYHWLAEIVLGAIGTVRASTNPGYAWGGVVYDLPLDVDSVTVGLSRLSSSPQPAAIINLMNVADILGYSCLAESVMATDGIGIKVSLWSIHGQDDASLSMPLIQFLGTGTPSYKDIDPAGAAAGSVSFDCGGIGATPLPRANVNGVAAPLTVGKAAVPPVWDRKSYYTIANRPTWGMTDAVVSPDVAASDTIELVGQPATAQSPAGYVPAANDIWLASPISVSLFSDAAFVAGVAPLNQAWSFGGTEKAVVTQVMFGRPAGSPFGGVAVMEDTINAATDFTGTTTDQGLPALGQSIWVTVTPLKTLSPGNHWVVLHQSGSVMQMQSINSNINFAGINVNGEYRARRLAVRFTLSAATIIQSARAIVGHATATAYFRVQIAQDNAGDPGAVIYESAPQAASGSAAWRVVDMAHFLDAGTYHFILVVNDNDTAVVADFADVGVENSAGDAAHVTKLYNPTTDAWDLQSFDLAWELLPGSSGVDLKLNSVSQGLRVWGSDIRSNSADVVLPASMQFGAPVDGEIVTIVRDSQQPNVILGSVLNGSALNLSGYRLVVDKVEQDVNYISADLATSTTDPLDSGSGPQFSPSVNAILGAIQFTTANDTSANGDRTLNLWEGADFLSAIFVADTIIYAEQLTSGRVVTIVFDEVVMLSSGKTYWLTIDEPQPINHSGVTVKPLSVIESDVIWGGTTVREAAFDWPAPVPDALLVTLQGISSPNAVRQYFLDHFGLPVDSASYALLAIRYAAEALTLGGDIKGGTLEDILAEIDRHCRTASALIGDTHYLADLTVISGAGLPRPRSPAGARISSPPFGEVKSELNYSYDGGNGSVADSARQAVIGVQTASLDLTLLADSADALAAATKTLDNNGAQRVIEAEHDDLALIPGDLVELNLFGATLVWRVVGMDVAASPARLALREL